MVDGGRNKVNGSMSEKKIENQTLQLHQCLRNKLQSSEVEKEGKKGSFFVICISCSSSLSFVQCFIILEIGRSY